MLLDTGPPGPELKDPCYRGFLTSLSREDEPGEEQDQRYPVLRGSESLNITPLPHPTPVSVRILAHLQKAD